MLTRFPTVAATMEMLSKTSKLHPSQSPSNSDLMKTSHAPAMTGGLETCKGSVRSTAHSTIDDMLMLILFHYAWAPIHVSLDSGRSLLNYGDRIPVCMYWSAPDGMS